MHVAEGALSGPVLLGGAALAAAGVGLGLRRLEAEAVPRVAVLSSAFFVASLIHVPLGPSSAHLVLNGLAGLILGWAIFPALAVALFLQALLFGFGGLTTLGVNTLIMALPGLAAHYLCRGPARSGRPQTAFWGGAAAGVLGIGLGAVILALALYFSAKQFWSVIQLTLVAHLPVLLAEAFITGSIAAFLARVKPELLASLTEEAPHAT